jgi:hypothetical protein
VVLNATTKEVLTVCGSEERGLFGQAKQTFTFALLPNASVGVVRWMVAEKLSTTSSCVRLQVLVRGSNGCEPVTCGSVADELDESNPAATTLALLCMTESRHSYFYLCCAALCAVVRATVLERRAKGIASASVCRKSVNEVTGCRCSQRRF